MWVVCPHVGKVHPAVHGSLLATERRIEFQPVEGSDRAYWDVLAALWSAGEAFCLIEHDILIHPNTIDEFEDCPRDWCAFPFQYMGRRTYGLGCVKFSADLIARNPDAMTRVGRMSDGKHGRRHWCRLDSWLTVVLEGDGEERHQHETMVRHLNDGCAHGCTNVG